MMKACFPYFGGKSRVASIVWKGLGQVANYVEPFGGSLAVLLANPNTPKIETTNDLNHQIANFWRSIINDPESVEKYADHPIHEIEVHARHRWLVSAATDEFRAKMGSDPEYYDAKIAGYWIYGQCASIGNNWLQSKGLNALPNLSTAGGGIYGLTANMRQWFQQLQQRLKRVRVCCHDWNKLLSPSVIHENKCLSQKSITGVFLDPPYDHQHRDKVYIEDHNIFGQVAKWAIDNGDNARLRIALCGYSDYEMPEIWQRYHWKSNGLASLGNGRGQENKKMETIWFSPHCLKV